MAGIDFAGDKSSVTRPKQFAPRISTAARRSRFSYAVSSWLSLSSDRGEPLHTLGRAASRLREMLGTALAVIKGDDSTLGQVTGRSEGAIQILVVTDDQEFLTGLEATAKSCRWQLIHAVDIDEAMRELETASLGVVIIDRDLYGADWRMALRQFSTLSNPACVFLASWDGDDEYLWSEVVRNHGYDVLPKPVRPNELIRSVDLAWHWWKDDRDN